MTSYMEYLMHRIFNNNNNKNRSGRGLSWFQIESGHNAAGTFRIP